jgi:hypothetical protein
MVTLASPLSWTGARTCFDSDTGSGLVLGDPPSFISGKEGLALSEVAA